MTKDQLISFKTRIESELCQLEQRISTVKQELLESAKLQPAATQDGLDHAKDETDMNTRLELNERDLCLTARLRRALNKIALGTYGHCACCEEPIDMRRLQAHPTATLCILCQEQSERNDGSEITTRDLSKGSLFNWSLGSAQLEMV